MVLYLPPLAEKYSGGPDGYDQSIPKRVFNVLLPIGTSHLLYIFLKHMTLVDPVFHRQVFCFEVERCYM